MSRLNGKAHDHVGGILLRTSILQEPIVRALIRSLDPYILMLLATIALASLFPAQGFWAKGVGVISQAAIVLLFFLHGAKLSREAIIQGVRHWRLHVVTLTISFVVFPLAGLLLTSLHLLSGSLATGLLFLSFLPSTVQSSIAFTAMARGNVAAAVCSASLSNLFGIVLTPLLAAMALGSRQGPTVSWDAVETIVMQLLVPFLLGHLARPLLAAILTRHKALVSTVDRGSILLVVYSAFGAAVLEGLWHSISGRDLGILAGLCIVLLSLVMAIAWIGGGLFGFAREDRIVLLFCGSKKSLASGVPLAGVIFPSASVGMTILPLMLFHQIQLIACAAIARQWGRSDEGSGQADARLARPAA